MPDTVANQAATIRPAVESDVEAITDIYNDAITTTTAVFTEQPTDRDERLVWMRGKAVQSYPVLVAAEGAEVVGFSTFGEFRAWPGYRYSVEHSVYVRNDKRGRGYGKRLVEALFAPARALGKHVMIAGIEADNQASIELHERLGFLQVGRLSGVGRKFGRWLDLVFMQRLLEDEGAKRAD